MMVLLNQQKVQQLSDEIGAENLPVLLDIFLGELVNYQQGLLDKQDGERVNYLIEISHALKSSAASFGADRLCDVAKLIDNHAKDQQLNEVAALLSSMQTVLVETQQAYQAYR